LVDRREAVADAAVALKRGPLRELVTGGVVALGVLAGAPSA
jgi:hypothetical protein